MWRSEISSVNIVLFTTTPINYYNSKINMSKRGNIRTFFENQSDHRIIRAKPYKLGIYADT